MGSVGLGVRIRVVGDQKGGSGAIALNDVAGYATQFEHCGVDALFVAPFGHDAGTAGAGLAELTVDPYVALGACAATTEQLLLGCCPVPNDGRLPSLVAKVATGLDVVSNGRAVIVFGSPDVSHESLSGDDDIGQLSEQIEIVRAMSRVVAPSFDGTHYRITGAWNEPRSRLTDAMPIGLLVSDDGKDHDLVDGNRPDLLDLAARFCEYMVIRSREDTEGHLRVLIEDFAKRCHRSGRLRSEVRLLALIENAFAIDERQLIDRLHRCTDAGCDGVVLEVTGELGRDELMQALVSTSRHWASD